VSIISPKKMPVDEVYKVFESVLDVYGFATVRSGDVIKIIQVQQAKEKGMETRLQHEAATTEDKYVTQIISLDHASPDEMKRVLDPLISKTSVILSYPPTGMLIIADVLSNIKRLQEIIEALDVEGVGEQISYIPLKYAAATEAIKSLNPVFQQQKGTMAPIKLVADERTNALIIAATENDTIRVRELIALMDKEIPKGAGAIRVYYLQNAKAEDMAKVLTSLPQQTKTADAKTADAKTAVFSKNVQIVADKATNALIITADQADYLVIEDVVKKLDIPRSMVYLEALIMEVSTSKDFKLGVEWQGAGSTSSGYSAIGGVSGEGGNYGIASGLAAGLASTPPALNLPSGLSLGIIGQAISVAVGGTVLTFPNLAAFIQAYQKDTDIRILSTPQLLTLDNEDAEITVGRNVPYITRQDTTVGTTTNYSNYEYKDVGITLKVTPQINKEGFVRLKIDQTVTAIDTASDPFRPTTTKRAAKTTVTVRSGDTVVIGGLIDDTTSEGVYKVPLLGDIPLLGWLFKYKSKSEGKQNLFIFITPRIIQKPQDAANIHQDRKDYMETLREGTIKATPPKKKK
jgi:general secretion pathway protein D